MLRKWRSTIRVDRRRYWQLERMALTRMTLIMDGQDLIDMDLENLYLVARYSQSTLDDLAQQTAGIVKLYVEPPFSEIAKSNAHIDR
jgi:hypothetical protein